MEPSKDDKKLIDAGLLTEREAANLPQWAKRKIVQLMLRLETAEAVASTDSVVRLNDGLDERVAVGDRHTHVEVTVPGSKNSYDVSLYVNAHGEIELNGYRPLSIELCSSNRFKIHPQV